MTPIDEIIRAFDMDMYRHMFLVKSITVDDRTFLALLSTGNASHKIEFIAPLGTRSFVLNCASGPIRIVEELRAAVNLPRSAEGRIEFIMGLLSYKDEDGTPNPIITPDEAKRLLEVVDG